jgi:thioredoxin-like negative regulator of GroEL
MKRILRFTASWCGPCQGLAMNLASADLNMPIEVVDIDTHSDIAQEYGIRSVPTLVMLDENTEVKRLIGSKTINQLQEWAND